MSLFLAVVLDRRSPLNTLQRVAREMERWYLVGEPRAFTAEFIGSRAGVDPKEVRKAWDVLVARGFLVEHPRRECKRCFTIALPQQQAA